MKYDSFARDHLSVASMFGEESMCRCIFHDDTNASMQFNQESGLFICFSCGARGNIQTLANRLGMGHVDTSTTLRDVYDALRRIEMPKTRERGLPESSLARYDIPTNYWEERNLSISTIERFQLGADPTGEFVTIPMRDEHGKLLGFIKRFLTPDATSKYRYPKGMKKSHHLFGAWAVSKRKNAKTVVLTEGSIDAMMIWQAGFMGMGILGSEVSETQMKIMLDLDVRRVILFFDNDRAGTECTSNALGFTKRSDGHGGTITRYDRNSDLRRYFSVEAVNYPKRGPKDPGAMTREQIEWCLDHTRSYL